MSLYPPPGSSFPNCTFRIRLYSTKTLKPLGTLGYHKDGCQAVAFASTQALQAKGVCESSQDEDDSDEEMGNNEKEARSRWLVGAGKDSRVSIWTLISFGG